MSSEKPVFTLNDITRAALDVGFSVCGVSRAEAVDRTTADAYRHWIADGCHATMAYLAENVDKRLNPTLLHDGVKSIVSVALNYAPRASFKDGEYTIAAYALGKDYHDIVKNKLHRMAACLGLTDYRAFCDTAPVLERYWAAKSGIGFIGRNRQLIIPGIGSMFFLGELFIKEEVVNDSVARANELDVFTRVSTFNPSGCIIPGFNCGSCRACMDACPTGALSAEDAFDARLCLSYHTIENRGEIPAEIASKMGTCFYGCDRCLNACPHNRKTTPTDCLELQPVAELLAMTRTDWHALNIEDYRRLFKGSAVKRAKFEGLKRNIELVSDIKEI